MTVATGAGSTLSIASAYGTTKNMTAITNATEAVATLEASHGIVVGDYFEVTSGWERLNKRVVRAKAVSTNDVTLEGINTSNTADYPAGSGTGTIREISTWTQISQIKADSFQPSGGEQQYVDATPLSAAVGVELATIRSPFGVSFDVMDTSAGLTVADGLGDVAAAIKITKGTRNTVGNATWTVGPIPSISGTGVTTRPVSLRFVSVPVTYET